ncbi:MAG: hypothetical protein JWQ66_1416 [Mucilaginibacter sp.]|nr:hypothetical protein [Mucilaginibacter sp.]
MINSIIKANVNIFYKFHRNCKKKLKILTKLWIKTIQMNKI